MGRFILLIFILKLCPDAICSEAPAPDNVLLRINNQIVNSTLTKDGHSKNLELIINIDGNEIIIDLSFNSHLLYENYKEKLISDSGFTFRDSNLTAEHCYYIGKVRNYSNSLAAISTCSTIQGFFSFNKTSYQISQPVSQARSVRSKYRIRQIQNDSLQHFCDNEFLRKNISTGFKYRNKRAAWESTEERYAIELYIVNDYNRFVKYNRDASKLFENTKAIVNMASAIYEYVGVHVVLVGAEIFTTSDKFQISTDKSATLSNFASYRRSSITQYNDNAFLIAGTCFANGIIGSAFLSTMCSFEKSCGIVCEDRQDADHVGKTLAHEIGHNLGLNHDFSGCSCPDTNGCVMNAYNVDSMKFSSCSTQNLSTNINFEFKYCLTNRPTTIFDRTPVCGNALVDANEACDCGNLPAHLCNKDCCNSTTCQLIGHSQCAQGSCCNLQTCHLEGQGHVCRPAKDVSCDVEEVCSGNSNSCPLDLYKQDSTDCTTPSGAGYCAGGVCGSRTKQCQLLWGRQAENGLLRCYQSANVLGSLSGYCAIRWGTNTETDKCDFKDVECGLLHCIRNGATSLQYFGTFTYMSYLSISGVSCYAVTLDMGPLATNPGMVPDGSPCGNYSSQMCYRQKCVDVATVRKCRNCPSGYICANNGECVCDSRLINCALTSTTTSTTSTILTFTTSMTISSTSTILTSTTSTTISSTSTILTSTTSTTSTTISSTSTNVLTTEVYRQFNDSYVQNIPNPIETGLIVGLVFLFLILIGLAVLIFKFRKRIQIFAKDLHSKINSFRSSKQTQARIPSVVSANEPSREKQSQIYEKPSFSRSAPPAPSQPPEPSNPPAPSKPSAPPKKKKVPTATLR